MNNYEYHRILEQDTGPKTALDAVSCYLLSLWIKWLYTSNQPQRAWFWTESMQNIYVIWTGIDIKSNPPNTDRALYYINMTSLNTMDPGGH